MEKIIYADDICRQTFLVSEFLKKDGSYHSSVKEMLKDRLRNKENYVLFCPECGEGSRVSDYSFGPSGILFLHDIKGRCPKCGKGLTGSGYHDGDIDQCRPLSLNGAEVIATASRGVLVPGKVSCRRSEDRIVIGVWQTKVSALCSFGRYYLKKSSIYSRIVFNLRSGLTYVMSPLSKENAKSGRRISSMSFACRAPWPVLPQQYAPICSFLDSCFPEASFASGRKQSLTPYSRANYLKDLSAPDRLAVLKCTEGLPEISKELSQSIRKIKKAASEKDFSCLPGYVQKKSVKRRLSKNICLFLLYRWLFRAGVRDVNVQNAVADEALKDGSPADIISRALQFSSEENLDFVKWASKGRNAKSLKSLLKDILGGESMDICQDSSDMLDCYEDRGIRELENCGSLKEIHGRLMRFERQICSPNRKISYDEDEIKLEEELDGYSFRLAENTDALHSIADEMDICVSAYANAAVNKVCTIMTMEKGGRRLACMELRKKDGTFAMVQLKAKYNGPVKETSPVRKWAEKHGIRTENCEDLREAA